MNTTLLLAAVLLTAEQPTEPEILYSGNPHFANAIASTRSPNLVEPILISQNDGRTFREEPGIPQFSPETTQPYTQQPYPQQPGVTVQNGPELWDPTGTPQTTYDPFLGVPPNQSPVVYQQQGVVGPVPYQQGWTNRTSVSFLASEGVSGPTSGGRFGVFGVDTEFQRLSQISPNWMWSFTPEFSLRSWEGPQGTIGLPGNVFRFGLDFELISTPSPEKPYTFKVGFNPSINSDFENSLSSDAWNFDGHAVWIFPTSSRTSLVLGLLYWDRVNDYILPEAGVIFRPHDRWEFRMMFPESKISYFLGHGLFGGATWVYARGEYHVEAYEVQTGTAAAANLRRDKVELQDWRILFGMKKDYGAWTGFVEAGWVFGRDVDFLRGTPGFDINSGFIGRMGFSF